MLKLLNHCWQVLGTAIALLLIYCGGLAISFLLLPLLNIFANSKDQAKRNAQRLIHLACKLYITILETLRLAKVDLINPEKLPLNYGGLIVANHPTLLDVILIMAAIPRISLVAKSGLWEKPWLRTILTTLDCIENNPGDDPHDFIRRCAKVISDDNSLLIFPEGTRSLPGQLGKFHRSAAAIALEGKHQIVPIYIEAAPPILTKDRSWYHYPRCKVLLRLLIMDSIAIKSKLLDISNKYVARRKLTAHLESIFAEQIQDGK
jgi:1-acyl-sn-glycerol-3-phosphate acyltransferase